MLAVRLGIRLSNRGVYLSFSKPSPWTSFFSSKTAGKQRTSIVDAIKPSLNRLYSSYSNMQRHQNYSTYQELGYGPGRRTSGKDHSSSRRQTNFNNFENNVWKPTLFTLVFSAATYYTVPYLYDHTPLSYFKQHPMHLLYGLIGINVGVFALWQVRYNNVALYRVLENYFLMDRNSITRKSIWSMVWSTFSHQEFFHLFMNMACLYSFSTTMIPLAGIANYTSLYLISGCVSSWASMVFSFATKSYGRSLGASGAISGIFAAFTAIFPHAQVALFVFPIPGGALTALLLFTAYNLGGCLFRWSTFDYAAHLGGTAVGYFWGVWYASKLRERMRRARRSM